MLKVYFLGWTAGENFTFHQYLIASNCHNLMFLTNSKQCPLTKCYLCKTTYFAYTPQGNFNILSCEISHLPTVTGSGVAHPPTTLLAPGLTFSIDSNEEWRNYLTINRWLQKFLSIDIIEMIDIIIWQFRRGTSRLGTTW